MKKLTPQDQDLYNKVVEGQKLTESEKERVQTFIKNK